MSKSMRPRAAALVLTIATPNLLTATGGLAGSYQTRLAPEIARAETAAQYQRSESLADARANMMIDLPALSPEEKMKLSRWRLPAANLLAPVKAIREARAATAAPCGVPTNSAGPTCQFGVRGKNVGAASVVATACGCQVGAHRKPAIRSDGHKAK